MNDGRPGFYTESLAGGVRLQGRAKKLLLDMNKVAGMPGAPS
jgi:hypothetical protein